MSGLTDRLARAHKMSVSDPSKPTLYGEAAARITELEADFDRALVGYGRAVVERDEARAQIAAALAELSSTPGGVHQKMRVRAILSSPVTHPEPEDA